MAEWNGEELARIAASEEVQVAPLRRDGKLANRVTIWAVRHADGVYVRSVRGRSGAWYRGILERHEGRIWAGRVEQDVTFVEAAKEDGDEIDAAYRAKYRRYAGRILNSVFTAEARSTTLKLMPLTRG